MIDQDTLVAGAATLDRKVANFAKDNGLGDLEFLSCIPGSIGGAVIMNSGCYENDISKILVPLKLIDKNNVSEIEIKKDIKFSYRGTNLPENLIITSAKFKGALSKKELIEKTNLFRKKKIIST